MLGFLLLFQNPNCKIPWLIYEEKYFSI